MIENFKEKFARLNAEVNSLRAQLKEAQECVKKEVALSDSLKIAARMHGTGSYVDWVKTIRKSHDQLKEAQAEIERLKRSVSTAAKLLDIEGPTDVIDLLAASQEQLSQAQAHAAQLGELLKRRGKSVAPFLVEYHAQLSELESKLAASQANEQQLREALESMCHEFRGHDLPYGSKAYANATTLLNRFLTPDTTALEAYVKPIEESMEWYKRRLDLLQKWQSNMRDPERTIVCDIIANGMTMEEGGRYSLDRDTSIEAIVQKAGEVMRERCWHSVPFGQIAICGAIRALPGVTLEDLQNT